MIGATKYYVASNHLFSPAAITDISGSVVERYSYGPYGKRAVLNPSGTAISVTTVGFQSGFTGLYEDAETGLNVADSRYYMPSQGRWISRDPIGYVDGTSLYRAYFVPNELDPLGLFALCLGSWGDDLKILPLPIGISKLSVTYDNPVPGLPPVLATLTVSYVVDFEVSVSGTIVCQCMCPSKVTTIKYTTSYSPISVPISLTIGAAKIAGAPGDVKALVLLARQALAGNLNPAEILKKANGLLETASAVNKAAGKVNTALKFAPSIVCSLSN